MRRAVLVLLLLAGMSGEAAAKVRVPDGFRLQSYARGIEHPSNLAFDPSGRLWVTSAGHLTDGADGVWMVPRRGAKPVHVVKRLFSALGVLWHQGELYVSHVTPYATVSANGHTGRVVAFSGLEDGRFTRRRVVVDGLPTGRHRVDSLAAGPDGRIHLGVGSEFDARRSSKPLSATVVSFHPDGSGLRVEARGLRNPYGLAFIPGSTRLLISEHGRDDLGLNRPPEEINVIDTAGPPRWFGFPECWDQGGNPCQGAREPLVKLTAHSAPGAVVVASRLGPFGRSAYVTRYGSSFSGNPSGGDIVRVTLPRNGRSHVRRFATGFGIGEPLGLALRGSALYVSLWESGRVLRVMVRAPSASAAAPAPCPRGAGRRRARPPARRPPATLR